MPVPLAPLGLQNNTSPLGLNPVIVRPVDPDPVQEPLWVHTLTAATHRVTLYHPKPLLALTTDTHSMRLYRSEPGNDDPC